MVKRKAKIDLDEWLRWVPALARMENTSATPTQNEVVLNPTPFAEISTVKVEVGAATSSPLGTPNSQEEDNEWFGYCWSYLVMNVGDLHCRYQSQ